MLIQIGKGIELDVDTGALPSNAMDHIIYMGLRNVLMDSHASFTEKSNPEDYVEKSREIAEKKLDALMRGEVRMARTTDAIGKEARAIAVATLKEKGITDDDNAKDYLAKRGKDIVTFKELVAKLAGTDKVREKARERVEENKADAEELDI